MADRAIVWFLVQQDEGVLVALRKPDAAPFAGQWTLPGDLMREQETPSYAIARFGRDELNIEVLGDEMVKVLQFEEDGVEYATGVYRVGFQGQPRFRESGPYVQVGWAFANDLPQPMPEALADLLRSLAT